MNLLNFYIPHTQPVECCEGYFFAMPEAHGSESAPHTGKKAKKAQPLTNLNAEDRVKQFGEDFYAY